MAKMAKGGIRGGRAQENQRPADIPLGITALDGTNMVGTKGVGKLYKRKGPMARKRSGSKRVGGLYTAIRSRKNGGERRLLGGVTRKIKERQRKYLPPDEECA